jgi:PAS domain S-box-containing protein
VHLTSAPTPTAILTHGTRRRVTRLWTDRSLRTKGWVVLAIPAVALCLGTVVFARQDRREQRAATWMRQSYGVKAELQRVDLLLLGAESSVRNFLLSGQPDALADFQAAQATLPANLDALGGLVSDDASQRDQLLRLRSFVDRRLASLSGVRDAAMANGVWPATVPPNVTRTAADAGTAVRQQLDAMQAEQDRLLATRADAEQNARSRTRITLLATLAGGLLGGLLATTLFTAGIAGRVRRLVDGADRLAQGQPVEAVAPTGDEIGRLAAGLVAASGLCREREAALAHESDLLSALMDNLPYPVFFKDTESRFTRVNKASAELAGIEASQFTGKTDFDLFPAEQAWIKHDAEQRLMTDRQPIVNWIELSTLDGHRPVWGLDNKAPIIDRDGRVTGLVGSSIDITELKRAEEAQAHLAAIVEWSNEAIVGVALDGTITSWNPRAAHVYGYTEGEAIGQSLAMLVPPDREVEISALLAQAAEGIGVERQEMVHARTDGRTFDVALTISPVRDAEGIVTGAAMIARDISARKQAEMALQAANKELEAFTYSVSHDLRAPLRAMNGFSRILIEDYSAEMPDEARHYLQLVQDNARQMGRLVDDLLAFSRLGRQPVVKRPVDLASLVQQVFDDLRADREGRNVALAIDELPVVEADPGLMRQVFTNLIGNALKFTRGRDVARIEIGPSPECAQAGEEVISVKDNGVGFDMTYAPKLFGVFQRLHRAEEYEGTGVGLALVQRIVHRHGGRIWAEAAVDKGATFYVAMPAALPAEESETVGMAAAVA